MQWHSDMTFQEYVPAASVLYAVTVPPASAGGATQFIDMRAATESMPAQLMNKLRGESLRHCSSYRSDGHLAPGRPEVTDVRTTAGYEHPAVISVPSRSGIVGEIEPAVFPGRRRNAWIVDHAVPESEAMLDDLWSHLLAGTTPSRYGPLGSSATETGWGFREVLWEKGDLLIWHNHLVVHRRLALQGDRLMWRTQVTGARTSLERALDKGALKAAL